MTTITHICVPADWLPRTLSHFAQARMTISYIRQLSSPQALKIRFSTTETGNAMKRRKYLRNLKDTRIVITLEYISYDILIHTNRQRFGVVIKLYTLPARGSHTARDWVIQMTFKSFVRRLQYEL